MNNTDNNVIENGNGCEINQNDVNNSNSVNNNKNENNMETTNENQKSNNSGFENQTTEVKTNLSNINIGLDKVMETHQNVSVSNDEDLDDFFNLNEKDDTNVNNDGVVKSSKKDKKLSNTKKGSKSKGKIKSDKKNVKPTEKMVETKTITMLKSELVTVNIDDLTIHPIHSKLFGENENYDFLKLSMEMEKDKLSLTPPIVNKEMKVVDGVLRLLYCKNDLKCKTIEVIVKDIKEEDILMSIIKSNIHRKYSCIQTLNVFDSLMEFYSHQGRKTSVLNDKEVGKSKKKEGSNLSRNMVCKMMNVSYSNIDKLKKIKDFDIRLFTKIDEGKKTIHKVFKSIGKKVKDTINIKTDYSIQNVSDSKLFKVRKYDETSKMDGIVGKQIQCVVTSPPKFLGEETDRKQYIDDISNRLIECHRILNDEGSLYLIMEDIHSGGVMTNIPFKVLMKLIGFGYNHIDTIIWEYPSLPTLNVRKRIPSFKYIFHLTKGGKYYMNEVGRNIRRNVIPMNPNGEKEMYDKYRLYKGKDWNKVWFSENIIKTNRFETIPIGLILDSTKEGDYVMNPFDTDESVGLVSLFYNRKFFGFTDDEEYVKIQSGILHSFLIENRKDG